MRIHSHKKAHDQELLTHFQQGDAEAFTEIYQRYRGILYRHALRMLQDRDEAQDVIQEVFARLWAKRDDLKLTGSLSSYLYSSVRNRILDLFAREKISDKYRQSLRDFVNNGEFITDDLIREKELATIIEREVSGLPEKMREVFRLSRDSHLSYAEIANELDIAENTVRKHITKALQKLRTKLEKFLLLILIPFAALAWLLL